MARLIGIRRLYLSDLPEQDQEVLRRCVKRSLWFLRSCEGRLETYAAEPHPEELHRSSQTAPKTMSDIFTAYVVLGELLKEIASKHNMRGIYERVSEDTRREYR